MFGVGTFSEGDLNGCNGGARSDKSGSLQILWEFWIEVCCICLAATKSAILSDGSKICCGAVNRPLFTYCQISANKRAITHPHKLAKIDRADWALCRLAAAQRVTLIHARMKVGFHYDRLDISRPQRTAAIRHVSWIAMLVLVQISRVFGWCRGHHVYGMFLLSHNISYVK